MPSSDGEHIVIERPELSVGSKIRRALGAAITDGFFLGSSRSFGYLPVARPRLHGVELFKDIAYIADGNRDHLLDIYRPRNAEPGTKLPVVLYIHGGAFRILSKETHWVFGLMFARHGYVVASINYRLAPASQFPAAIQDASAAWQWVVKHIAEYGGDPTRIVVAGESAGGNLSTGLAIMSSYQRPEPFAKAVFDLGVQPRAVMPASGLLQVSNPERFGLKATNFFHDRLAETTDAYLRGVRVSAKNGLDLADPLVMLERGEKPDRPLPPFFAPVGTWDILIDDTRRLERALTAMQVPIEARYYSYGVHGFHGFVFLPQAIACWRDAYRFLDRTV